ncbi:hypothetical protein EV175_002862 [Coemansia sp. RSA 1933]|nr:hypothetical protein EV175_002862 [Coemansia sp. RSA 1933]
MSAVLASIDPSHYSADFLETLLAIVSRPSTQVIACAERLVPVHPAVHGKPPSSYHYEVRLTTSEGMRFWQHYAITNGNHQKWRESRTGIRKQDILPIHSTGTRFRAYEGALSNATIRRFALEYIGFVPNLKWRFYQEIVMRERLARMQLPGIVQYRGCIIEDGFIVGVALGRPQCSLGDALKGPASGGIPCSDIVSTELVHAAVVMQKAGVAFRAPVRPSAVMLDHQHRLVLVDIDCLFPGPPGMLFDDLLAAGRKVPAEAAESAPPPLAEEDTAMVERRRAS